MPVEHGAHDGGAEGIAHTAITEVHEVRVLNLASRILYQRAVLDLRLGGQLRPTRFAFLVNSNVADHEPQFSDLDFGEAAQCVAAEWPETRAGNGQPAAHGRTTRKEVPKLCASQRASRIALRQSPKTHPWLRTVTSQAGPSRLTTTSNGPRRGNGRMRAVMAHPRRWRCAQKRPQPIRWPGRAACVEAVVGLFSPASLARQQHQHWIPEWPRANRGHFDFGT